MSNQKKKKMLVKFTVIVKQERGQRKDSGRDVWIDLQAEEELLGDAQQAGSNGHDQQTQSTEHMDGEIRGA